MKPVHSFIPMADWLLRTALAIIIYQFYFSTFLTFSFEGMNFFMALAFIGFTFLLLIGGFARSDSMTVISGLAIFILSIVMMFIDNFTVSKLLTHFTPAVIGFNFLARGNHG